MATLQKKIAEKFLVKMKDSPHMDPGKIEKLRALLTGDKKPKPEEFVAIFTIPAGGDLK